LANGKGTPLSLAAKKGTPPLKVNNTVKVKNLNSDLLDGKDSTSFLGKSGRAADSAKLGGQPASGYVSSTGTAADSAKLGGQPAADYVGTVYAAQTSATGTNASAPLLSGAPSFDVLTVPAGTYLVALTADLANNDAVKGEFACQVMAHDTGGNISGQYGNVGISPGPYTYGATQVSQVLTLQTPGTIYAYCAANSGDTSHTAYVYNSTLSATRIQNYVGTVHSLARSGQTPAQQPKAVTR
jgi:hypothetical protein